MHARTIVSPNTAIGIEACFLSLSLNFDVPLVDVDVNVEESRLFCVWQLKNINCVNIWTINLILKIKLMVVHVIRVYIEITYNLWAGIACSSYAS